MDKYSLAPNLSISRIITGLWQIADLEKDGQQLDAVSTAKFMEPYADAGFTTFDMADHYGSSEIIAGTFRNQLQDKNSVQLLTKWVPSPGKLSKQTVREAVEKALDRMQSASIDLLQFHAWNYADASYLDQLYMLQELKEEGLINHLGLTNFDADHLRVVVTSGIEILTNQVCFSILDQRASGEMAKVCQEFNVGLLAFGTVAGGFLTEKWLGAPEPDLAKMKNWSLLKYKRFIDTAGGWSSFQSVLKTLQEVATAHQVSIANIATKYMLDQPAVAAIIIGARLGERAHFEQNAKLFEFELTDAQKAQIRNAIQVFNVIPGDCGDEYRKPPFLTATGDLSHHIDALPAPFDTVEGENGTRVLSGTTWEREFGYCRAIRKGNQIKVSGTTASHGDQLIGGSDPSAQTQFVIDKIEGAIQSLGGRLEDVNRTRIFIKNMEDWKAIASAHGRRFRDIQPANTLVRADLVGDEFLVEMEAEATCD